jgi:hypothetical protein
MSFFPVFSTLRSAYPTWEALHAHLVSKEGGSLRVTVDGRYALISYDKEASNFALAHVPFCRSVVWDTVEHRPANIMPPKTQTSPTDLATGVPADYVLEEHVDGVPIGVFFDKERSDWRIHTRTVLDASNRYYSQTKTFANLCGEADFPDVLPHLDKTEGVTFVLQHPENRIVVPIGIPKMICVHRVKVEADARFAVLRPQVRPVRVFETLPADWSVLHPHTMPFFRGYLLKNTATGQQWKFVDPLYAHVAVLRGEGSRLDFRWMTLWQDGLLDAYLHYYPEEAVAARALVDEWIWMAPDVFEHYTQVFFARTKPLSAVPPKFRSLVSVLHEDYKQYREATGNLLNIAFVGICLEQCDVKQMIHVLNWDLREAAKRAGKPFVPATRPIKVWSDVRFHLDVWVARQRALAAARVGAPAVTATCAPPASTATCN